MGIAPIFIRRISGGLSMLIRTRGQAVGTFLALLQALQVSYLVTDTMASAAASASWVVEIQPLILIGAWANVIGWVLRLRFIAVPTSLATIFTFWGFGYWVPLTGLGLGVAAVLLRPTSQLASTASVPE